MYLLHFGKVCIYYGKLVDVPTLGKPLKTFDSSQFFVFRAIALVGTKLPKDEAQIFNTSSTPLLKSYKILIGTV